MESFKNLQLCTFGHMADGNLHIIAWTGREDDVDSIYERVYTLVGTVGGTITAEHGIGTMKRQYLSLCRSVQEIDLMRAFKKAMDPNNILNLGGLFEVFMLKDLRSFSGINCRPLWIILLLLTACSNTDIIDSAEWCRISTICCGGKSRTVAND